MDVLLFKELVVSVKLLLDLILSCSLLLLVEVFGEDGLDDDK